MTTSHEFHSYYHNVGSDAGSKLVEVNRSMNESISIFSPIEDLLMRQVLTPAPRRMHFPGKNTKFELPHQKVQFEKTKNLPPAQPM